MKFIHRSNRPIMGLIFMLFAVALLFGNDAYAISIVDEEEEKARVELVSYETDIDKIYAGNTFTLKFGLKNKSREVGAKNLVIRYVSSTGSASDAFLPESGADMIYLDRLEPGMTVYSKITFTVNPGTPQNEYGLVIQVDYG